MLGSRLILALAAFASLMPCCNAQTGFSACKNRFTPDEQVAMGNQSKRQVYQQMPVLADSSPVTQYIQKLGAKLIACAPGYKWPYNFHVVDAAEINAFALPGGSTFEA